MTPVVQAPPLQDVKFMSVGGSPLSGSPAKSGVAAPPPVSLQRKATMSQIDREQLEGLRSIRAFLKLRTPYDVLPLSFRLIVMDTRLLVKKSLNIMHSMGIVSAPLWDSHSSTFAGLLTIQDYLNVVQYYWQNPESLEQVETFKLDSLREIERAIGAPQIETVSITPERNLYEACRRIIASRARRIPIVETDDETGRNMVLSVITQYRILKFIALNVATTGTEKLRKPIRDIKGLGTFDGRDGKTLRTFTMQSAVIDVIHALVEANISAVPILDDDGTVLNLFEAVDVITLLQKGDYTQLSLSVGEALLKRSDDFPGIYTCTVHDRLDTILDTIRRSRVHRFVVVDDGLRLKGILTLSDVLSYLLLEGLEEGEDS